MHIILVRHGQTAENVAHRHQPAKTPLSITGRKQAVAAGKRLADCNPTHVVSSPVIRALETASLIANELDIIPSIDHDLRELVRPLAMTGHKHFSLRSLLFYKFWFLGWSQGGESYRQLRHRVATVRSNLECLPENSVVVVVSHTVFINLFLAHINRSSPLWPWQAVRVFLRLIRMKNTAMVELTRDASGWHSTNDLFVD